MKKDDFMKALFEFDQEIWNLIKSEEERQRTTLGMIPSESFTIPAVRDALSSVFVHKYAEGEVGNRYYEGNVYADQVEELCKKRVRMAFHLPDDWDVNVQAHSGCNANLAVYNALLSPNNLILSMYLPDGGHLSHGWSLPTKEEREQNHEIKDIYFGGSRKISIVSKFYEVIQYKVETDTQLFDYDKIEAIAQKFKPRMIVSGGTAYPRNIDYKRLKKIAVSIGAYYLADISHEAGLISSGALESPVGIADVVTFTTHKTLRGPRGAIILSSGDISKKINSSVFPGIQGGPHLHSISAIAVCLKYALSEEFKQYTIQTIKNAKALADYMMNLGYSVVSKGTDKHLLLIDLRKESISGKKAAEILNIAGIVLNKNTVPNESGSSVNPSGIRMGTPILTIRGMQEEQMKQIAIYIDMVLKDCKKYIDHDDYIEYAKTSEVVQKVRSDIRKLCIQYSLPE